MKFNLNEKAIKHIKDENIDNIVVDIDLDSKSACCGLGSVDFDIKLNAKDKVKNFKKADCDIVDIYYSPSLEFYFKEDSTVDISSLGFYKFKKMYVTNEINVLK